jgi:TusA-related sulfurtransferase
MPRKELELKGNKLILTVISDNPFIPTIYEFDLSAIEKIEIEDDEIEISVAEMILQCGTLEQALKLVSDPISFEEEKALNELKIKLEPQRFERQLERVNDVIAIEIGRSKSKLTVGEVLSFMCENILGIKEVATMLKLEDEMKLLDTEKIQNAIQKLESIGW